VAAFSADVAYFFNAIDLKLSRSSPQHHRTVLRMLAAAQLCSRRSLFQAHAAAQGIILVTVLGSSGNALAARVHCFDAALLFTLKTQRISF
jgi:hypothetical protein